ncbi:MAG TPA: ABC transporter permease subunit [Candidatus Limiplasma sp.]|nr:ABC transporter permease subunit [Candidatus Limiplasma sp.]
MTSIAQSEKNLRRYRTRMYLKRYWTLYAMLALPLIYFIIFKYIPMTYIQIAFKKFSITKSAWEMDWAKNHGFQYFIKAFSNKDFYNALRNTIMLNMLNLILGFPAPIILAIVLNELPYRKFKRFTQTIAYMPHFLSWVIISGLALQLFATRFGLVNTVLRKIGVDSIPFLDDSAHWVWTYVFLGIWQSVGWNTIIYLAALTGINPELYEAASVDGASRMRKIWHITLPGLKSTIVILLIIRMGYIIASDFDQPYAMSNTLVTNVSNVLSIFVYNYGIKGTQQSLATAVGLFQSVVGVMFLLITNSFAKRLGERGLW